MCSYWAWKHSWTATPWNHWIIIPLVTFSFSRIKKNFSKDRFLPFFGLFFIYTIHSYTIDNRCWLRSTVFRKGAFQMIPESVGESFFRRNVLNFCNDWHFKILNILVWDMTLRDQRIVLHMRMYVKLKCKAFLKKKFELV